MNPKDKATHPYWGTVEIVTPGDETTVVKLANGVEQTVTTRLLKPIASAPEPAVTAAAAKP